MLAPKRGIPEPGTELFSPPLMAIGLRNFAITAAALFHHVTHSSPLPCVVSATSVSDQELPSMLLPLLSFLFLLPSLAIAKQTVESNATTTSPCSLIEEAFGNITEAGDEVPSLLA